MGGLWGPFGWGSPAPIGFSEPSMLSLRVDGVYPDAALLGLGTAIPSTPILSVVPPFVPASGGLLVGVLTAGFRAASGCHWKSFYEAIPKDCA